MIQIAMPLTVLTLPNEFPLVFAFRVFISVLGLALLIWLALALFKNRKIDKSQRNALIVLSAYVVLMLYYTVLGRYFKSDYMYDGEIFSSFKSLAESFSMSGFSHLVINLIMMVPVSFLLMFVFNGKYRILWALDISIVLILTIEKLQFFTKSGTFQLDDIVNNSIGVIVGIVMYYVARAIYKKKRNKEL